jgi:hypothetical protein
METASESQRKDGRRPPRRQLPRSVIWLALLAALIVAVIGAAMTQSVPSRRFTLPEISDTRSLLGQVKWRSDRKTERAGM